MTLPGPSWWPPVQARLGTFVGDDDGAPATCHLDVALAPGGPVLPPGEPTLTQDQAGTHLAFDQFRGVVSPDGRALLSVSEQGPAAQDETYVMAVDSLLRIQLAQALAQADGILMHAAGIVGPARRGAVFFGPSGSGKTTMCRLSARHFPILCDEVVAIRLHAGRPVLYGTPFAGAWGRSLADACPLAGLFRLRHARETSLVAVPPARAVREILESTVYYDRTSGGLARALTLVSALVTTVPVTELAFEPKEEVWQTLSAHRWAP
ncbi:MAG: hypothetical protein VKQ33_02600 [Candidatus Sericytochromatia bacterium]|nr:hypothetical protein [Candidatus Sericytochromatia bacterium]